MFVTLPKVFNSMPMGGLVGTVFLILVFFAALTSAISLMETVVSIFRDKFNWSRKFTSLLVATFSLLIGIPSSLGFGVWNYIQVSGMSILDLFDFASNSILMPIVALCTCLFIGHFIGPKVISDEVRISNGQFKREKLFSIMIKWVAPIFLVAILISSILNALKIINI